jgi:hypothetical protein
MRAALALAATLAAALLAAAAASSGDEGAPFRACAAACAATGCTDAPDGAPAECSPLCGGGGGAAAAAAAPLALRLARWDCAADCAYLCMWAREARKGAAAAAAGARPRAEKYFGKWPFRRLWGMQEPASVAFSIANLAAAAASLAALARRRRAASLSAAPNAFASLWAAHFALAANAWLWSAAFHTRDTRLTERLDYFSAGAAVAFNLFLTLARVLRVERGAARAALAAPIAAAYAAHVRRMLTVLFDYGLHVGLCVGAGAAQTALWLGWALLTKEGRAHPQRRALLAFTAAVNASMLLEVLDFPPLGAALDAHALWHAATAPLAALWFAFVAADAGLSAAAAAKRGKRGKAA